MNIIQNIAKQRITYVNRISILFLLFLVSCSASSVKLPPIIEESPVDSKVVWQLFLEQYPSMRLPYKMKLSTKISIQNIIRRLTIFTLGDSKGLVKMDILSSGMNIAKIAENPMYSLFYVTGTRKAYITKTDKAKDIEVLLGFSIPFSLDSLCAIISGNASSVFSSYTTVIPRDGLLEFILPDNSSLFLSYTGKFISWQNTYGWRIEPIYSSEEKQQGVKAVLVSKGYSMEYIVDVYEDISYTDSSIFYLQLPPNTQVFTIKE